MRMSDFVVRDAIIPDLAAVNKEGVIREMAASLRAAGGFREGDLEDVVRAILKRELLGSTGIGRGVAIPHTKHSSVDRLIGNSVPTQVARVLALAVRSLPVRERRIGIVSGAAIAVLLQKRGAEIEIVIPASLVAQWRDTLADFEITARIVTHDSLAADRLLCDGDRFIALPAGGFERDYRKPPVAGNDAVLHSPMPLPLSRLARAMATK